MSTMYFFYQRDPEGAWDLALASERQKIQDTAKPAFVTVLDLDHAFDPAPDHDQIFSIGYRGPFYADFDSQSLEEVIPAFQEFLKNLEKQDVRLEQCRLFASGGKGFHVEVPFRCFADKKVQSTVTLLPLVYKEMALALAVDTLDMRVYSTRRGRMWRTPNVQRPNGMHKIQLTLSEALTITPETYREICASPRPTSEPAPPTLASGLALLYAKSKDKVVGSQAKRKASVKSNGELKARYNNTWPPLVQKILAGTGLSPDAGFQKIATQLAITAHALDMKEKDLLDAAEDLCQNHVSDSGRYNTYRKRVQELSRMYHYMNDNPGYTYSAAGVRSLVTPEVVGEVEGGLLVT